MAPQRPYPTFATLAPTAPQSPATVSTPSFDGASRAATTLQAAASPKGPSSSQPLQALSVFDPHFELPEHGTGLVEPGAYDDYNPLPSLSFPPLPFTLPPDDALALSIGGPPSPAPFLASSSSLFFPAPAAATESLFSFTESSALASFLTSSSDEPLFPPPPPLATTAGGSASQDSFANLVKSRGAWDFNPHLPDFLPIFGREEARRTSFGASGRPESGERGEEASRRLSGLRISPSPFQSTGVGRPSSGSPFGTSSASRSGSFDRHDRSGRPPPEQRSLSFARATPRGRGERPKALSPSAASNSSADAKPRSSSTTVADLLALDRVAASGQTAPRADHLLPFSASGPCTVNSVGLGFDVTYLRGPEAMAASARTSVFDSPTQPTTALPLLLNTAVGNEVDSDREMSADEMTVDEMIENELVRAGSSGLSSGSTVIAKQEPHPPSTDEDQGMLLTAPTSPMIVQPASHMSLSAQRPLPPPPPAVTAPPTREPKRVRSSAGSSLRGSSASVSRSPETPQGPLPKRQKTSIASAAPTIASSARSRKSVAIPAVQVKAEEPDLLVRVAKVTNASEPEDENEEDRKGPKPLLTAEQKRTNHILSEQKRRNAIRTGYAELSHLLASSPSLPYPPFDPSAPTPTVPTSRASGVKSTRGGARGGSKSNMLSRAAGLCRFLDDGNMSLEEECVRIERLLQYPAGGR